MLLSAALLIPAAAQGPQREIPAATLPGTADEMSWWETLRAAGREGVEALARKDEAISRAKRAQTAVGNIRSGDEKALIPKRELDKLNTEVAAATEKLVGLLRDGREKGFHPPLPDRRPTILHRSIAGYSDEARHRKISGTIIISLSLNLDGTLGDVKVVKSLGAGLDENALAAARQILFLPAIKEGAFVSVPNTVLEFTFNLY